MPETPPKPTDDLSWATDEAPVAPKQGRRQDGWLPKTATRPGEFPALSELDWHAYEMGQRLEAATASAPRVFDDMIDAIDGTVDGEIFYLAEAIHPWLFSNKTSKHGIGFSIDFLKSDGRRIYYVQNGELIAATARPVFATDVEWTKTYAAMGVTGGGINSMSVDGQIVVVTSDAASTYQAVVLDASDGTILHQLTVAGALGMRHALADSSAATIAFVSRQTVGQPFRWTPAGGFQTPAGGGFLSFASKLGPSEVIASFSPPDLVTRVIAYDRLVPTSVLETTTNTVPDTADSFVKGLGGTGDTVFAAMPRTGASPTPYLVRRQDSGVITWTYDAPRALANSSQMVSDDLNLYFTDESHLVVVSRSSGAIVFESDFSGGSVPTQLASDARYLWHNSRTTPAGLNRLSAYRVARQRGYWLRTIGDPSAHDQALLAVPLTRADGGSRI